MANNRIVLWVVAVAIVLGFFYRLAQMRKTNMPQQQPTTSSSSDIVIGSVLPLTGDGAAYGLPIQKAGQLAVDEINASGGISGKHIKVVWEDGKCEGKEAASAAQKLMDVDRVSIIFGGACSSEVLAMAPLTEPNHVILMSPSATNPDISSAGDYVFRTAPSDALAGRIAGEYAAQRLGKTVAAVISEQKDYAQGLRRVFTQTFKAKGGVIVADEVFNSGDTDMREQVLKVKAANPQVVYIVPQTPASGVLLLRQIRDGGLTNVQLLTAEVLMGRDVIKQNSALMEGMIGIEPWFDEQSAQAKTFVAAYKARYNNEDLAFPSFMANMYSQFYLMKQAIESVGMDTTAIKDYLLKIKDWHHALGSLTFDANGDPNAAYSIKKIENGEAHEIEVYRPKP